MPEWFQLPSGARVAFERAVAAAPLASHWADELEAVALQVRDRAGAPATLRELPLADYHVARALARRLGVVDDPPVELTCTNCEACWKVRPTSTLETGPYRDAELDDPELDRTLPFLEDHRFGREAPHTAAFGLTPLAVAAPLGRGEGPLRMDSAFVRALGLSALDGERDPRRVARRLARLSDEDFEELCQVFEAHHYAGRLEAPHACSACGAVEWVAVPTRRELGRVLPGGRAAPEGFPDAATFERLVAEIVRARWGDDGPRDVVVDVVEGPADCDAAGVPLLGSYLPPDPEGVAGPAVIRLYHRTFRDEHATEPFDVRAEIAETLRHELEHHVGFLQGADPLDDDERTEIDDEAARRVGRRATRRRAVAAAASDARGFWSVTWPVWAIVLLATAASLWLGR